MKKFMLPSINKKKAYMYYMLILVIIHVICNKSIKTISFMPDDYIPIINAATITSNVDWSHCRQINFYYGYPLSLIYSPLFLVKKIYTDSYRLTQSLLSISSMFHVISSVLLLKIVDWLSYERLKPTTLMMIGFLSSLSLQFYSMSIWAGGESLFILCNLTVFFLYTKLENEFLLSYIALGFFTILTYTVNSRGIVIVLALCVVMLHREIIHKFDYLINNISFWFTVIILMVLHESLFKPIFLKYFYSHESSTGIANTNTAGFISKIESLLFNSQYLIYFIKCIIRTIWVLGVNTYGLSYILLIILIKYVKKNKTSVRNYNRILFFELFILTIMGTTVLYAIVRSKNEFSIDRADMLFYARYHSFLIPLIIVLSLTAIIDERFTFSIRDCALVSICNLAFFIFFANDIKRVIGMRYSIVHSTYIAMFLGNYFNNCRFGIVNYEPFYIVELISLVFIIAVVIVKNKKYLISLGIIISCILALSYSQKIVRNMSNYYCDLLENDLITCIEENSCNDIYISDSQIAWVMQYCYAEKVIWGTEINQQDMLIIKQDSLKNYQIDNSIYTLDIKSDKWNVFIKKELNQQISVDQP